MQGNNDSKGSASNQKPGGAPLQNASGLSWSAPAAHANTSMNTKAAQDTKSNGASNSNGKKDTNTAGKGSMTRWVVGGVVVGTLLVWAWLAWTPSKTAPVVDSSAAASEDSGSMDTHVADTGSMSAGVSITGLSIPSPQDAGLEVQVSSVSVTQPTWVVVYESRDGKPGNALGAALFFPESKSGSVKLLRATLPGQTYFVGESIDNNDHMFSLQDDERVADIQGNPVWTTFKTR